MQHLKCTSTFKIFELHAEFVKYAWQFVKASILTLFHCLQKIPPPIHNIILKLLEDLGPDLPDITPCRFLQHAIICDYLTKRFLGIHTPMLMDLHASLANWEHIHAYINQAVQTFYPHGTGWKGNCYKYHQIILTGIFEAVGLIHFKATQDKKLSPEDIYIWFSEEIHLGLPSHKEDDPEQSEDPLRIIVCLTKECSCHLLEAQYLQSDIGFYEFELGGLDLDSHTSITFLYSKTHLWILTWPST